MPGTADLPHGSVKVRDHEREPKKRPQLRGELRPSSWGPMPDRQPGMVLIVS
jgi:hypothetical protein